MKKLSTLGMIIGASLLWATPVSLHWSPTSRRRRTSRLGARRGDGVPALAFHADEFGPTITPNGKLPVLVSQVETP